MDATRLSAARGERQAELVFKNAKVLNVFTREIIEGDIAVQDGMILGIGEYSGQQEIDLQGQYAAPGFIDAHLHLESTMAAPQQLIANSVCHGTTTYIADPHEAANVKGWDGIQFILEQTENVPANVYVMLPSCVPAAPFELSGCRFDAAEMAKYKDTPRILGLGEVMDYIAVVTGDAQMQEKLHQFADRPKDGHAPGLSDKDLNAYVLAGIATDHECMTYADALRKRRLGMHIHIREGSAAKNLTEIVRGLVASGQPTEGYSFCTDDLHIEDIKQHGHIDHCIRKAIALGLEPLKAYQMATINAARCYGLHRLGAIAPGYQADFVILTDLEQVKITSVWYKGKNTADWSAQPVHLPDNSPLLHTVNFAPLSAQQLAIPVQKGEKQSVIGIIDGQIATEHLLLELPEENGQMICCDGMNKLAVVERHHATGMVGVAPLLGFGVQKGAIASSVSHDSHNLLVAGDNDADMLLALEELKRTGGGYTIVSNGEVRATLPLPILGLISDASAQKIQDILQEMLRIARELGVPEGIDPFITLSFLALPVIPALRLTPRGLFDVEKFAFLQTQK